MHIATPFKLLLCISLLLVCLVVPIHLQSSDYIFGASSVKLTTAISKPAFHLRELVSVFGNFTDDGSPVSDVLVAVEVRNPEGQFLVYRTIPIGNPIGTWSVSITGFYLRDMAGNPVDSAKIGSMVMLYVTVSNLLGTTIKPIVTVTVYDGNLIPLYAAPNEVAIGPYGSATVSWSVYISEWAYSGKALVYCNAYSSLPKDKGRPLAPEKSFNFHIKRSLDAGSPYAPSTSTYSTSPGKYNLSFKIPPDRYTLPGNYPVYVVGHKLSPLILVAAPATTFTVESFPCPPQAAFTYSPLEVYANMTVRFDASSSSAEGYNDTIIRYEWYINDPNNPETIIKQGNYTHPPSPFVSHIFEYGGTYRVDLNVTDNEGLWSTTSKPINIYPEFGPTANFTWSSLVPFVNETVTFDASSSKSGWSARTQSFSPIESYRWNFSDGTGIITVPSQTVTHIFTNPGNYTVTLTVTDSVGRSDSTMKMVEVLNITAKYCDIVEDGIIDMKDIFAAILAFGSQPGQPKWNPRADVVKDNVIDMKDIFAVIMHFGKDP